MRRHDRDSLRAALERKFFTQLGEERDPDEPCARCGGLHCSGNGISELIVTILAGVAQFERGLISERIRYANQPAKREGSASAAPGNSAFVGEDNCLVPNEAEQKATATIRRLSERGASLMAIRNGIRRSGVPINQETARQELARPEKAA